MVTIEAAKLTREFAGIKAVDSLDLQIEQGEIFGLVGPDGAGKTTAMRLLAGILEPTSGEAKVCGHSVTKEPDLVRGDIAYMPQRFGLYHDLTVIENLDFYADIFGVPQGGRAARMERLMSFSGLGPFKKRLAGNLSGGMKQKLGLACALIHTPRVLLLDEPTNGVDPVSRRDFWQILYQLLKEQVTILFSTSYLDEAERCSRVGFLYRGRLLCCDDPAAIKAASGSATIEESFIATIGRYEQR